MKLFNFFKLNSSSNKEITPTKEIKDDKEKIISNEKKYDKEIIEKKEIYYKQKLRILCQVINDINNNEYKLKVALEDGFNNLINADADINVKIENKEELLQILNLFFEKNKDLCLSQEKIINFVKNDYNLNILSKDELKEKKVTDKKLKNLRNIIYDNYKAIKNNDTNKDFAWMIFCQKNKLNKKDLMSNLKIALLEKGISNEEIDLEMEDLNIILSFGNIPTDEEVQAYRSSIENSNINDIKSAVKFYKEKVKNNENEIYIKLYSIFYWARFSYKTNKSNTDILESIINLLNEDEYNLVKDSMTFEGICTLDNLKKYQINLERYVIIINLKKYIKNWKQIKTNQIHDNENISIEEKNRYFKELEEDYLKITSCLNSTLENIENCIKTINARDYIKKLDLKSIKIMKDILSNNQADIILSENEKKENTFEKELESIKRWQEIVSNLRKY